MRKYIKKFELMDGKVVTQWNAHTRLLVAHTVRLNTVEACTERWTQLQEEFASMQLDIAAI